MRNIRQMVRLVAMSLVLVSMVKVARATEVSLELSGVKGPVLSGVYTDPYQLKISQPGAALTQPDQFANIQSVANAFCDDFKTDTYLGEVWQGHVTNMSALSGIATPLTTLKFDNNASASQQQHDYMAMAWLADEIVATNQSTSAGQLKAGELSFALWNVFDGGQGGALSNLSWQDRRAAKGYYNQAYQSVMNETPSQFLNVNIYTPDPRSASQEFLVVGPVASVPSGSSSVPAPNSEWLFAGALVVLAGVTLFARKRRLQVKRN